MTADCSLCGEQTVERFGDPDLNDAFPDDSRDTDHNSDADCGAGDERLTIIDEAITGLENDRRLGVEQLIPLANELDSVADTLARDDPARYTMGNLAAFAREIVDAITDPDADAGDGDGHPTLADLTPPTPVGNAYATANSAAGNHVALEAPEEDWQLAEALAKAKLIFGDAIIARMNREEWRGEPLAVDLLLAAASQAGLPTDPVMQAVALPPFLDSCPWCRAALAVDNGASCCSAPSCYWDDRNHSYLPENPE